MGNAHGYHGPRQHFEYPRNAYSLVRMFSICPNCEGYKEKGHILCPSCDMRLRATYADGSYGALMEDRLEELEHDLTAVWKMLQPYTIPVPTDSEFIVRELNERLPGSRILRRSKK